jgi:hypothetical protein
MNSYFYMTKTGRTQLNGSRTRTFYVFRINRNEPIEIGSFKCSTGMFDGDIKEVRNFIEDRDKCKSEKQNVHCVGEF